MMYSSQHTETSVMSLDKDSKRVSLESFNGILKSVLIILVYSEAIYVLLY